MTLLSSPRAGLFTLLLLLLGCDAPDTKPQSAMGSLMGDNLQGYTQVTPGQTLRFPEDHQAHNDFRQEWWYLTANLTTASGQPLGLQWTQFRIALSPKASESSSTWASNQLYMAHSAVTTAQQHVAKERWARAQPQLAGSDAAPLAIKLDNWLWQSQSQDLFPATLTVSDEQLSYRLALNTSAPYQLQGDKGYSIKSGDGSVASYYYSQPFIQVTGEVTLEGKSVNVSGDAWLDREWSSQFLNKHQQGWDWFALRLDDGSALMLFQLRSDDNQASHFYSARRMYADGSGRNIDSTSAPTDIKMTPTDWQQTPSGRYPVAWRIAIASEQLQLTIKPLNRDSHMPLSVSYWEGPISISGSHQGTGYMELTGY
ncbi:lipocalin-like domain-containing protein [Shewanella algidipiscicola]|uniref:lipocalin-like domain-containing protein n=1 Tax=Shewanella algidipiscicola TaxID=614070 RepID=UPI000D7825FD|nr:lipocalin-like domain-containing protein [Shewanella algidipiscicola]